eukprot:3821717-Prymnesium_polylepis.2
MCLSGSPGPRTRLLWKLWRVIPLASATAAASRRLLPMSPMRSLHSPGLQYAQGGAFLQDPALCS